MSPRLSTDEVDALEEAVDRALVRGDAGELRVVGYGEITLVVEWSAGGQPVACKRLAGLADQAAFDGYQRCVARYLERLAEMGIEVPDTTVQQVLRSDGGRTAYCVQPVLPSESLLTRRLGECRESEAVEIFEQILDRIRTAISDELGLDAQLSNWAWFEGRPLYFDISTPMIRNARGEELFDVELHLASVPWALRGLVRYAFLKAILDKYYDARGAILDLFGNMFKERLDHLVAAFAEAANRVVSPAITRAEALRYYRSDARMWALLQGLRRVDRWWQRSVRRRRYPFLLPGKIAR